MDSFAHHLFTPNVKAEQDKAGMREKYARVYETRLRDGFDDRARAFITSRTSFYIASVTETGWPYVQHRGGPAGFLQVLDGETLAYADYRGNKQFITTGNLTDDDRVSLFLMDYPTRTRLKLIGHARTIQAADDPDLARSLGVAGQGPVERLTNVAVVAMDWNCPQYIEERYTQDEVTALVTPTLAARDAQIKALSDRLTALGEDPGQLLEPLQERSK